MGTGLLVWAAMAGAVAWVPSPAGVWTSDQLPLAYCPTPVANRTDLAAAELAADLEAGVRMWAAPENQGTLECTAFRFVEDPGPCPTELDTQDGTVSIYFESNWELPPGVLGFTLSTTNVARPCDTVVDDTGTSHELPCRVGSDIMLNDASFFWSRDPAVGVSVVAVVGHEVGHLLGLDHCEMNGTCQPGQALMFGAYSPAVEPALQADDREGACALYPREALPEGYDCRSDAQCSSRVCAGSFQEPTRCTTECGRDEDCEAGFRCQIDPGQDRSVCLELPPPRQLGESCSPQRPCAAPWVCDQVCVTPMMPDGGPEGGGDARVDHGAASTRSDGGISSSLPPITGTACSCMRLPASGGPGWSLGILLLAGFSGRWRRPKTRRPRAPFRDAASPDRWVRGSRPLG